MTTCLRVCGDFGEFDQKGTVRTKYGTKQELIDMIKALHDNQISVYLDVVLNHKAGGDYAETFPVVQVDGGDRLNEISDEFDVESFTGYSFEGRGDKYSPFKWHWYHFSGVDRDNRSGKDFAGTVWHEITNNIHADITLDQDGKASFPVSPRNISVWVRPE